MALKFSPKESYSKRLNNIYPNLVNFLFFWLYIPAFLIKKRMGLLLNQIGFNFVKTESGIGESNNFLERNREKYTAVLSFRAETVFSNLLQSIV